MSAGAHTVGGMNPSPDPSPPWTAGAERGSGIAAPEWTRVIGVFDLETTGVDVVGDRIVTAHVGLLDASGTVLTARDWLADPGVVIPEGATAVHGITTEYAREHGRPAGLVVSEVVGALVRKGLVAQSPVAADQRQRLLTLTPAGLDLWRQLPDPLDLILKVSFDGVEDAELATVVRVLRAATERLTQHLTKGTTS